MDNNLKVPTHRYAGPAGKGGRNYAAAVDVMMYNYDYFISIGTATELKIARNQFEEYTPKIQTILAAGIESGLIPENLQTADRLSDMGNYIFQGYFTKTDDEDTFNAMRETSQLLIQQAPGATLNCDQCQQTQSVPD